MGETSEKYLHPAGASQLSEDLGRAPSVLDRMLRFRDRLLQSPAFRRWAIAFPLTRPLARRRAKALFDIGAGFVYSQILAAAVELDLFNRLAAGPATAESLAGPLGLSPSAAERLLKGGVALRLFERRSGGRYGLGALGHAMVGDAGLAGMIRHHARLYADLAAPVALLRGDVAETQLRQYWPYAQADRPSDLSPKEVDAYSTLMSASQTLVAGEVLHACRLDRRSCLLDVGGGEGTFLTAVAPAAPHLKLMLLDLPAVARRAAARFAAAGLKDRATAHGANFLSDPWPQGADTISFVRVVHDLNDADAATVLARAHAALPANGELIIAEPMAQTPGAESIGDAYFGFYLLAMGQGRPRPESELRRLLTEAGFTDIHARPTRMPLFARILTARAAAE